MTVSGVWHSFATSTTITVVFLAHANAINGKTMNDGIYAISNSNQNSATFNTTFFGKEFFEIYSPPIRTSYAQVLWRMMEVVPLPQRIIDRFENKVMAVVGYEVDQVRTNPDGVDVPVPITHAYNHHYAAWLVNNRKVRMVKKKKKKNKPDKSMTGMMNHGSDEYWSAEPIKHSAEKVQVERDDSEEEELEVIPLCHFFSEGNGGEMRLSYHGYADGYAQLIESPNAFHIQPMQIDTWNREEPTAAFRPGGPLPKSSQIPASAGYSGLIECPCSDRLEKKWWPTYELCEGSDGSIKNATQCLDAVKTVASGSYYSPKIGNDDDHPSGCSLTQRDDGGIDVFWNTHGEMKSSPIEVSRMTEETIDTETRSSGEVLPVGIGSERTVAFASAQVNVTVASQQSDDEGLDPISITIVGPPDRWFAVGFGSDTMCLNPVADECPGGGPYAIVVNGAGHHGVQERKLAFHGPGDTLESSIRVESISEKNGFLTVVLTRPLQGWTEDHYTFDTSPWSKIPIITAKGCPHFDFPKQHCGHGPSHLTFLPVGTPQSVCFKEVVGSLGGDMFHKDCLPSPKSDLKDQANPTCTIQSYIGGLSCCRDGIPLLDKDQEVPWKDQVLEYQIKFRFYFEEYTTGGSEKLDGSVSSPSHKNLIRLYWQTEARAGEYDIVKCADSTPPSQCVQTITSRWKVKDMLSDCSIRNDASWCTGEGSTDPNKTKGVDLIYAAPHCHAPSCISMELYNADTGQLICRVKPQFGKSDNVYDEHGFLALPPCLWGDEAEGLLPPPGLSLDTTLLSIKKNNSTLAHTGEMASWQMRGAIVSSGS